MTITGEIFSDRVTADSSTAQAAAYINPAGLQYTIGAERRFKWDYLVRFTISGAVSGIDIRISSSGVFFGMVNVLGVASGLSVQAAAVTSPLDLTVPVGTADTFVLMASGMVVSPGSVAFGFKQDVADAGNPVTVSENSLIFITKIA